MSNRLKLITIVILVVTLSLVCSVYFLGKTSTSNASESGSTSYQLPKNLSRFNKSSEKNSLESAIEDYVAKVDLIFDGQLLNASNQSDTSNETLAEYKVVTLFKGDYSSEKILIVHESQNTIPEEDKGLRLVQAYKHSDGKFYDFPEYKPFYRKLWPNGDQSIRDYFKK